MKYKKIPDEYFITILDRLTRFEPIDVKFERVINDIITKFCFDDNKPTSIQEKIILTENIINNSLTEGFQCSPVNEILIQLEEKYFQPYETYYQYLSNRFNYIGMLDKIDVNKKIPKNVAWLKSVAKKINDFKDLITLREKESLLYPIEKIVLCEGQTEFCLLQTIFCKLGYDFDKKGVLVLPAGGKNQVAKKYYEMIEYIKIPIFILLDSDAQETKELIKPKLRNIDAMYLIQNGEFEDLIPTEILKETLNYIHNCEYNCVTEDFALYNSMVKNLDLIYKKYGFGEFKKAHFAQHLKEYIKSKCTKEDFKNSEINKILHSLQQI